MAIEPSLTGRGLSSARHTLRLVLRITLTVVWKPNRKQKIGEARCPKSHPGKSACVMLMMGMNSRTADSRQGVDQIGPSISVLRPISPPKTRLHILRLLNLRMTEKGNERSTGPPYTAGDNAMKQDSLLPRSGRIPRDSARNTRREMLESAPERIMERSDSLVLVP